jgi:hypothetical protein
VNGAVVSGIGAEWERVELLGQCLAESRRGHALSEELLQRLRALQQQVAHDRAAAETCWRAVSRLPLSGVECDVLACVVAPDAEPRIGWMFQTLQGASSHPYPTPALLQELLALDPDAAGELYGVLVDGGALRRQGLIQLEGEDPYQPIRPGSDVSARLLGRPTISAAPPGAVEVHTRASWDDLVLSDDRLEMLWEFVWWIQHRRVVVDEWGGGTCGGPVALFAGPSGTGKTYAAAVIAAELQWPLYRVDLGRLVSKYIGETEKNLNRLFDAAHGRPMVLQFDEADALFSKRGEVKEARDRYANMEVSHLLARVESHEGPCILTTNLRGNLDAAFARRFQVVVDFLRPDAAARTRLWQRLLPPRAPRAPNVDPIFLGGAVNLTGGSIRNAALHASYLAAGHGTGVTLEHVALAVWREMGKDGRELSLSDLGPLASFVPGNGKC